MRLRISLRRIQKFTVIFTVTIIVALTIFVLWEILVIGVSFLSKEFMNRGEVLDKEALEAFVKKDSAGAAVNPEKELKSFLLNKIFAGFKLSSVDTQDIARKIMLGGLMAITILVLGSLIYLILEILKRVFVEERRRYERYDAEAKIYFTVAYDIKTNMEFQVVDKVGQDRVLSEKHSAVCRNVSVEGLCFSSDKKLEKGVSLYIELYLPNAKEPIHMEGQVRWSHPVSIKEIFKHNYDTGVKLLTVEDKSVLASIHYDEANKITWSIVLQSVFGTFSQLQRTHKSYKPIRHPKVFNGKQPHGHTRGTFIDPDS